MAASLLKLATLWGLVHINWLERAAEEPWATYFAPTLLILVGISLIHDGIRNRHGK